MYDMKNTTALVKSIMEQSKSCRNSDSFLYFKVLEALGRKNGIDIHSMSIPHFLLNMKDLGFPPFESVRRARQKLQEHHPELAPCKEVADERALNEVHVFEYAKGAV